jgi:hypothetical protein
MASSMYDPAPDLAPHGEYIAIGRGEKVHVRGAGAPVTGCGMRLTPANHNRLDRFTAEGRPVFIRAEICRTCAGRWHSLYAGGHR